MRWSTFVRELWFKKFGKGGNVAEATAYSEDDLIYNANASADSNDDDDLFDED